MKKMIPYKKSDIFYGDMKNWDKKVENDLPFACVALLLVLAKGFGGIL